jgi:hypothetical protein
MPVTRPSLTGDPKVRLGYLSEEAAKRDYGWSA